MRKTRIHKPEFRNARRAFTLVEALAAGMILAMGTVTIATGIGQSAKMRARAREVERAAEVLDLVMTRIDLIGPARLRIEGPVEGTFGARHRWSAEIEPRLEADLYEIHLEVRWDPPSGRDRDDAAPDAERAVRLHTLLNDPPNSRNPILQWEDL
ncbi:MAG: hypothetical protein CMJ18_13965 [Phycisphaeraceae bacterium]|nr:hypothetical protein [Phycisphaeraceae bacterium]